MSTSWCSVDWNGNWNKGNSKFFRPWVAPTPFDSTPDTHTGCVLTTTCSLQCHTDAHTHACQGFIQDFWFVEGNCGIVRVCGGWGGGALVHLPFTFATEITRLWFLSLEVVTRTHSLGWKYETTTTAPSCFSLHTHTHTHTRTHTHIHTHTHHAQTGWAAGWFGEEHRWTAVRDLQDGWEPLWLAANTGEHSQGNPPTTGEPGPSPGQEEDREWDSPTPTSVSYYTVEHLCCGHPCNSPKCPD